MRRKVARVEPYYCSPETGCPAEGCPGVPWDSPHSHGLCSDMWHFAIVLHEKKYALTLSVFGTDLHPEVPAWHPARTLGKGVTAERLSQCIGLDPDGADPDDFCDHLGVPCKGDSSYLIAHSLWSNCGDPEAKLEQPESFWQGLELLARSWCECCELTNEEEDQLTELVKRPDPEPLNEVQLRKLDAFCKGIQEQDMN